MSIDLIKGKNLIIISSILLGTGVISGIIIWNSHLIGQSEHTDGSEQEGCNEFDILGADSNVEISNISFCNSICEGSGICLWELANKSNNLSICYLIEEDDYSRDWCVLKFAVDAVNTSLCYDLRNDYRKGECFKKIAVNSNEVTICELIENELTKSLCYTNIAVNNQNMSFCEFGPDANYCKNHVIKSMAIESVNVSLCLEISDVTIKDECIFGIFEITKNKDLCALIYGTARYVCYTGHLYGVNRN